MSLLHQLSQVRVTYNDKTLPILYICVSLTIDLMDTSDFRISLVRRTITCFV